jgi:quercetin dioxygenase-like cupin family protein
MKILITAASLGLLFAAAYAASVSSPQLRLTPEEVRTMQAHDSGAGTSGVAGIRTTVIMGDPAGPGPYTIRLSIPAHTKIRAHAHRDDRTAVVVAGVWYFGYGPVADEAAEKALPVGSFYTEPSGVAHFAETKADPVLVYISGNGPTDTVYLKARDEPGVK